MGNTSAQLKEFFISRSRTPVPQALTFPIDDVTRRHGVPRTEPPVLTCARRRGSAFTRPERPDTGPREPAHWPQPLSSLRPLSIPLKLPHLAMRHRPKALRVLLSRWTRRSPRISSSRRNRSRTPSPPAHFDEIVQRLRATDRSSRDRLSTGRYHHAGRPVVSANGDRDALAPHLTADRGANNTGQTQELLGSRHSWCNHGATLGMLRDAIRASALSCSDMWTDGQPQRYRPDLMAGGTLRGHDTTRRPRSLRTTPHNGRSSPRPLMLCRFGDYSVNSAGPPKCTGLRFRDKWPDDRRAAHRQLTRRCC